MRISTRVPLIALVLVCAACGKAAPETATSTQATSPVPASSAKNSDLPAAVADYLAALAAVESAKSPVSMEALFDKAEAAQDALMEVTGGENGQALLESLSESRFTAVQAEVRGLKINRGLDIYATPEPQFFLALAQQHGLPADIAFFQQYSATWGADLIPVYLKLRPQPTPCVRFGEGKIAPLYASWKAFAAAHANAYAGRAQQNLKDLEETVALGTCACDGLESVRTEQADFLKQFPDTPQAAVIAERREQLAKDPDVLPVNCR